MSKSEQRMRREGRPALDLLEEAIALLRTAPAGVFVPYLFTTTPFILGLFYFSADMTFGALANEHLVPYSLVMALLFIVMKTGQSIFMQRLRDHLVGAEPQSLGLRRLLNIAAVQTAIQPFGIFFLPLAFICVVPFAWTFSFFQNVHYFADGKPAPLGDTLRAAWGQARIWTSQSHFAISSLFLFWFFVTLNVISIIFAGPFLLNSVLGIETVFIKSPMALINTTTVLGLFAATWVALDPIIKTFYTLRCFYGVSLVTGQDLIEEMRSIRKTAMKTAMVLIMFGSLCLAGEGFAQENADGADAAPVSVSTSLDASADEVLKHPRYSWRAPRSAEAPSGESRIREFFVNMAERFSDLIDQAFDLARRARDAFFRDRGERPSEPGMFSPTTVQSLFIICAVVVFVAIAFVIYRQLKKHRMRVVSAESASVVAPVPNIEDESVIADQLPPDEWKLLGQELQSKGEWRLALRAFYLSSLASLSNRQFLSIARHKSNREYLNELKRRAHWIPGLTSVFESNIATFERVWYGNHPADQELVDSFVDSTERIDNLGAE